jgi:hypothetical protein
MFQQMNANRLDAGLDGFDVAQCGRHSSSTTVCDQVVRSRTQVTEVAKWTLRCGEDVRKIVGIWVLSNGSPAQNGDRFWAIFTANEKGEPY